MSDEPRSFEIEDLEEPGPIDPEKIAEEAQADFTLADWVNDIDHRETKVLVFRDMVAVDEYNTLNGKAQALTDAAGAVKLVDVSGKPIEGAAERHAALVAEYNDMEADLEAARAKMFKSAISVHLKGFPNIATKVANRAARKEFTDPATKQIRQDVLQSDINMWIDMYLFGDSVQSIVSAQGRPVQFGVPRSELGKLLSEKLPPSQWQRLYDVFISLTLTDGIAAAAVADPGF